MNNLIVKKIVSVGLAAVLVAGISAGTTVLTNKKIVTVNAKYSESAYDIAVKNGYKGTEEQWLASLVGEAGENGKSAYDLAVDNGYKEDVKSWLASLIGTN